MAWNWLKNYRVWDANRNVFAFPENWIEPGERVSPGTERRLSEVAKVAHARRTSLLLIGTPAAAISVTGRVLAANLARDLYRVDLRDIVSKYIGETEKNLGRVFEAAAGAAAVLLLDEADALFGKRSEPSDGSDRLVNAETAYLLQRIEAFEGLVIVATNLDRKTIEPVVRRFPFVIDRTSRDS